LIQIVKERFGQRLRLTKAANYTLTFCSVKLLFEVFNRFKHHLSDSFRLCRCVSGRRILQELNPLSTPSVKLDESFSSTDSDLNFSPEPERRILRHLACLSTLIFKLTY
jgi:hypothetical protein